MKNTDEKSGFYAALVFLIWPLLSVISAFKQYNKTWAKNIIWAFCAFYGFAFAIGAESEGSDIVRYVARLEYLNGVEMGFSDAINHFLESGQLDVLNTVITILVSRFTGSQEVLTTIYGIIFGFFFSRNLWYVLERLENKLLPITILLLVCFFLIIPIWELNGFRFWTASHIFIYGLLPFLFEGKKKGILISAASILVHFAFIVPVGILCVYLVAGNRLVLYFCFFVATFFISEIDIEAFNNLLETYAPEILQDRTASYRSESQVENYREGAPESLRWYAVWYGRALKWSIMGFLVVLFLKGRTFFKENIRWLTLFSFTLLFYAVANLLSSLPSGGRFHAIAEMIALALIILYIQNREQEVVMERFVLAATPALLLYVIVAFRTGLYSMSATVVFGNPIIALFFTGEHISLNDVIKTIL